MNQREFIRMNERRYQPYGGKPENHPGVGNFFELINFAVRQRNLILRHHLKTCHHTKGF